MKGERLMAYTEYALRENIYLGLWALLGMIPGLSGLAAILLSMSGLAWEAEKGKTRLILALPIRRSEIYWYSAALLSFIMAVSTTVASLITSTGPRETVLNILSSLIILLSYYAISVILVVWGQPRYFTLLVALFDIIVMGMKIGPHYTILAYISPIYHIGYIGGVVVTVALLTYGYHLWTGGGKYA